MNKIILKHFTAIAVICAWVHCARAQIISVSNAETDLVSTFKARAEEGPAREAEWRQRLQNILDDFARRGHPLATLVLDSVSEHTGMKAKTSVAVLHFKLNPGPAVTIDSILFRGNKLTRPQVLLRELPVQRGEKFHLDRFDAIPEKLLRLGFLESVAPPELLIDARGRYLLQLEVREGNSNAFNGVAGYNPALGNQEGYFTGLLDLQFNNLFGTGRLFNARWEKRGVQTQELGLRYREPWLFNYPVHISGGFQQLIQDTLYVERKWDLALELPVGQRFALLGALGRESISPDSLAALRLDLPRSSATNFQFGLRYESRDDPLNPRRGLFYANTLAAGRKRVDTSAVAQIFSRRSVTITVHGLVPTFGAQVFSLAFQGRQVTGSEPFVSITDQIRFGGATTLRGYREEEFRGSRVAWSNLEYRYLLSPRSRAFVFCDAGYFYREEPQPGNLSNKEIEKVKIAYGLGVRLDSPVGLIGLDYGLGENDDLLNGKVHVSLVNRF